VDEVLAGQLNFCDGFPSFSDLRVVLNDLHFNEVNLLSDVGVLGFNINTLTTGFTSFGKVIGVLEFSLGVDHKELKIGLDSLESHLPVLHDG